jgi:hypothetical protein
MSTDFTVPLTVRVETAEAWPRVPVGMTSTGAALAAAGDADAGGGFGGVAHAAERRTAVAAASGVRTGSLQASREASDRRGRGRRPDPEKKNPLTGRDERGTE